MCDRFVSFWKCTIYIFIRTVSPASGLSLSRSSVPQVLRKKIRLIVGFVSILVNNSFWTNSSIQHLLLHGEVNRPNCIGVKQILIYSEKIIHRLSKNSMCEAGILDSDFADPFFIQSTLIENFYVKGLKLNFI